MNAEQLRALQAPIKTRYRETPETARVVYEATGEVSLEQLQCDVQTSAHPQHLVPLGLAISR